MVNDISKGPWTTESIDYFSSFLEADTPWKDHWLHTSGDAWHEQHSLLSAVKRICETYKDFCSAHSYFPLPSSLSFYHEWYSSIFSTGNVKYPFLLGWVTTSFLPSPECKEKASPRSAGEFQFLMGGMLVKFCALWLPFPFWKERQAGSNRALAPITPLAQY